eukprot:scaffold21.g2192.t1
MTWNPSPPRYNAAWCLELEAALEAASHSSPSDLPNTLPAAAVLALLKRCTALLAKEPTVLDVQPPEGSRVAVVGDLHGQLHDLAAIFRLVGHPSEELVAVFDGDFVDRGAWSLELLLALAAWKVAVPRRCILLRGNHESTYCSVVYGFQAEVQAKYGRDKDGQAVQAACQQLFAQLPLAAVVAGRVLVLHGGLPRAPPRRATRRAAAEAAQASSTAPMVATLEEIRAASKGGPDPDPAAPDQQLACDVLWSDPSDQPGVELGARAGNVGIRWGPNGFLRAHGLRLILRGHEGPDARVLRPAMGPMLPGFTLDHDTPAGRLYTVFSAPRYPQFGGKQHDNLGAVAVLRGPNYDDPEFRQYAGAPRPQATCFVPDLLAAGGGVPAEAAGGEAAGAGGNAPAEAAGGEAAGARGNAPAEAAGGEAAGAETAAANVEAAGRDTAAAEAEAAAVHTGSVEAQQPDELAGTGTGKRRRAASSSPASSDSDTALPVAADKRRR